MWEARYKKYKCKNNMKDTILLVKNKKIKLKNKD